MISQVLQRTDWLVLPLVTVVMFSAMFAATVAWLCRPGAAEAGRRRSRIALEDAEVGGEEGGHV